MAKEGTNTIIVQGIDTLNDRIISLHSAQVPEYKRAGKTSAEIGEWIRQYILRNNLVATVADYDIFQAWVICNGGDFAFAIDQVAYRIKQSCVVVNCDDTNFVYFGKETTKEQFAAEMLELDTVRIRVNGFTIYAKPNRELLDAFYAGKCEIVGFRMEEQVTLVPLTEVSR